VPLKEIVERHGYDITELINDHGITINDFLRNGYALGEMCDAFSSRMNEREGMDVLYYLGVAAEHIRLMPMETLRSRLGYRPEMLEILGYRFAPSGAWTIADMIGVGLTMPLVIKAGMQTAADWERLKAASAPVTLQMLQAFGVTPELEASLVTRADLPSAVAVQQQQQPVYHSEASLTAVPLPCQKTLYTFYDPATVSPLTDFAAQKPAPVQPTVTASACTIGATTTTAQEEQFVHAPGIPMPRGATVLARSQPSSSSLVQPNKGPRLVPKKLK
jgi:transposase